MPSLATPHRPQRPLDHQYASIRRVCARIAVGAVTLTLTPQPQQSDPDRYTWTDGLTFLAGTVGYGNSFGNGG